jgi:hypothetical protein
LNLSEEEIYKRFKSRKIKGLKYYHPGLHEGLFSLPLYLEEGLKKGKVLTDKNPFIWEL